jgi:SAM-dependent methyltransferase
VPVQAELERYFDWLRGHGVRFEVADNLVRDPDKDGPRVHGDLTRRTLEMPGLPDLVEHRDPEAGIASDHATHSVAWAMLREPHGIAVWDIGCGTGVLAVVAALAGAESVLATDVDPRVLDHARATAEEAGVQVQLLAGSLLEPVPEAESADLVVANLPHKPVPKKFDLLIAQHGGPDGAAVQCAFASQAAPRLGQGARVLFFLHSLPDPRLFQCYMEHFDLTAVSWKRRYLLKGEYGPLQDYFMERARKGESFVVEEGGRRFLLACVWKAVRR